MFTSDKRIFVFEEDLTKDAAVKLKKILDEKIKYEKDESKSPNNDELVLWTNYKLPSQIINLCTILQPEYVKSIFDSRTVFDVKQFYDFNPKVENIGSSIRTLPWCNRQYSEFSVTFSPKKDKLVDINYSELINRSYYYNLIDRVLYYNNPLKNKEIGFDCCGDCALEARIIELIKTQYNSVNNYYGVESWNSAIIFKKICDISGVHYFDKAGHGTLF